MAVIMLSILMTGCIKNEKTKADERISEGIAKLKLPQKINSITTLTKCSYSNKVLVFCLETTSDTIKSMDVNAQKAATLENLRTKLLPQNLVSNLVTAEASVRYIYVCGKDTVSFAFSPDDLK